MRRVGVLVCLVLAGGVMAAAASAAPVDEPVHLTPVSTSVDVAPSCDVPGLAPNAPAVAGGTLVTFTLVPPGCD